MCVCACQQAGMPVAGSSAGTLQGMGTRTFPRQPDFPVQATHQSCLFPASDLHQ